MTEQQIQNRKTLEIAIELRDRHQPFYDANPNDDDWTVIHACETIIRLLSPPWED